MLRKITPLLACALLALAACCATAPLPRLLAHDPELDTFARQVRAAVTPLQSAE